ncbi:MAG TPA: hypothetical protein VN667_07350 [Burkholderiales bacterium]|nr:hypothetical protein [Burkholderiales bacterium]
MQKERLIYLAKSGLALGLVSLGAVLLAGCWWLASTVAGSFKAVVDTLRGGLE